MQHVILLEDNTTDAELVERSLLQEGIDARIEVATTRNVFESLLVQSDIDLVISDSAVGNFTAMDALKLTKTMHPQSGFIIFSGGFDSQRAEQARQAGAIDWVHKSELNKLPLLARFALESTAVMRRDESDRKTEWHRDITRPIVMDEHSEQRTMASLRADFSTMNASSVRRLIQAVTQLSMARDLETVQRIVRSAAREINGADGATFVLRDGTCCFYADEDAIAPLWKGQRFPLTQCISGWTMLNRHPAIVPDITVDPRIPLDAYRPTFVKSLIMVPIRSSAPIGAIGNYWADKHVPSDAEVQFIQALADSTSIALENVQLYQELERRVRDRTMQLQEANQSLQEFSYFVSHDLRSPIRHISAFATILEAEVKMPTPMAEKAMGKIKSSVSTMSAMLEGLLTLAQTGVAAIDDTPVNMHELAQSAAQVVGEQSAAPVNIVVGDVPDAKGSAVLLRQVWVNLISNAVKFSAQQLTPMVFIGADNVDGETRYFVRDNGVGFDMSNAGQLFTAFRRLHSDNQYPGAGVGLAIVNRIVTRHGGRVWSDSKPGEGATFFFTLKSPTCMRANAEEPVAKRKSSL